MPNASRPESATEPDHNDEIEILDDKSPKETRPPGEKNIKPTDDEENTDAEPG